MIARMCTSCDVDGADIPSSPHVFGASDYILEPITRFPAHYHIRHYPNRCASPYTSTNLCAYRRNLTIMPLIICVTNNDPRKLERAINAVKELE